MFPLLLRFTLSLGEDIFHLSSSSDRSSDKKQLFQQELNFLCPAAGPSQCSTDPMQPVFPPTSPPPPVKTPQSQEKKRLEGSDDEYYQYSLLSLGLKLIWMCAGLFFNDLIARSSRAFLWHGAHFDLQAFYPPSAQQKKRQPRLASIDLCQHFGASRNWLYLLKPGSGHLGWLVL